MNQLIMDDYIYPADLSPLFDGTTIGLLCSEMKHILLEKFNDVIDEKHFQKRIDCYDDHKSLGLKIKMPCTYCNDNTSIWHCGDHPCCAKCIHSGPIPDCDTCAKFKQDTCEWIGHHYHRSDYENYGNYSECGYMDKMLNKYSCGNKIECPFCFHESTPENHDCCVICENDDHKHFLDIQKINSSRGKTVEYPRKEDDGPMRKVIHQTYFGPQEFLVCATCTENNFNMYGKGFEYIRQFDVFDESITSIQQ